MRIFVILLVFLSSCVGGGLRKNDLTAHFFDSLFYESGSFEEIELEIVNVQVNSRFNGIDSLCRYNVSFKLLDDYRTNLIGLGAYVFEFEIREDAFQEPTRYPNVEEPKTFEINHKEIKCGNGFEYFYKIFVRSRATGNLVHISSEKTFTFTP